MAEEPQRSQEWTQNRTIKMLTYYGGLLGIAAVVYLSFDDNASRLLPFVSKEYLDTVMTPVAWIRQSFTEDASGWISFFERNIRALGLALYTIYDVNGGRFGESEPHVRLAWSYVLFRCGLLGDVVRDFLFFFASGDASFLWDESKTMELIWFTQLWCCASFDPWQILHKVAQHEDVKKAFDYSITLFVTRNFFSGGGFGYKGWIMSYPGHYELSFVAEYLTTMLPSIVENWWTGANAKDIGRSLLAPGWGVANHMHEALLYMLVWHHPLTKLYNHQITGPSASTRDAGSSYVEANTKEGDALLYATTEIQPGNGEMLKAISQWCGLWMALHGHFIDTYTVNPVAESAAKAVAPKVDSIAGTKLAPTAN